MNKSKKIILIMKVFLPILIKGIVQLYENVVDAMSENNIKVNNEMKEVINDKHINA